MLQPLGVQGAFHAGMETARKRKLSPVHIGVVAPADVPADVLVIGVCHNRDAVFALLCRYGQNYSGLRGGPGVAAG